MATWPAGLPQKLQQSGFSNTLPENVIRSQMDTGPDKARRRDVSAPEPVSGSIIVDESQYDILVGFFNTTIAGGALPFDWVHPITGVAAEIRLVGPPQITARSGDYYNVQLSMEIQP